MRLAACGSPASQEVGPVELKEATGEAILRVKPVFLAEEVIHLWIRTLEVVRFQFAGIGQIKRAAVLDRQPRQTLGERVAFGPASGESGSFR